MRAHVAQDCCSWAYVCRKTVKYQEETPDRSRSFQDTTVRCCSLRRDFENLKRNIGCNWSRCSCCSIFLRNIGQLELYKYSERLQQASSKTLCCCDGGLPRSVCGLFIACRPVACREREGWSVLELHQIVLCVDSKSEVPVELVMQPGCRSQGRLAHELALVSTKLTLSQNDRRYSVPVAAARQQSTAQSSRPLQQYAERDSRPRRQDYLETRYSPAQKPAGRDMYARPEEQTYGMPVAEEARQDSRYTVRNQPSEPYYGRQTSIFEEEEAEQRRSPQMQSQPRRRAPIGFQETPNAPRQSRSRRQPPSPYKVRLPHRSSCFD